MDQLNPNEYNFNEKLSFHAIWFDHESSSEKKFILNFFPCDNTVELIDSELNRTFLRRSSLEGVSLRDMFIGNEVRVYGRQIKITDYVDNRTARLVGKTHEHTVAVIKPGVFDKLGEIIEIIEKSDFRISKLKMCTLTRSEGMQFYDYLREEPFVSSLVEHIISGPLVAMELVGEYAVRRWNQLIGPTSPNEAKKTAPNSLRAIYGLQRGNNAFHGSLNDELAVKEAKFFFADYRSISTLRLKNTTCCVIKPHAVKEGNIGRILTKITNSSFSITAMQMFYLNNVNANEFLEVYKGVVGDYNALVLSFLDGPCVALEIAGKHDHWDTHDQFRKLCGPHDSEIAKQIRPSTIRAQFGVDKHMNAVHCTDLHEDTVIDLEYFFKILNNKC